MLVLTRKPSEALIINKDIRIVILGVKGTQVRIGIEAPKNIGICREEIYNLVQEEIKNASASNK
ncbi:MULTISPECIES: carbon storage regulator CsrA [unclassified Providencia]|uniref:carbon storage regulator CsrA n=1 Tax=unclassified Providencia TaxID=2633465 RepID=UPI0023490425|nr:MULTISPECIES: carbon storage regulator CsrA [unclassified Providencia]